MWMSRSVSTASSSQSGSNQQSLAVQVIIREQLQVKTTQLRFEKDARGIY
jgi:hypothetical protein